MSLRPRTERRRGVMLFAVIIILAVAALAVGALSVAQEAEHAGQVAANDRAQQRAAAWSGALAVAAVLDAQRERIALGEAPDIPAEMLLWEEGGRTVVARPLPVGPAGERAVSETSKRALATITAEELALTGVVGDQAAQQVMARRAGCDDIEGLVDSVRGLSPTLVLGPVVSTVADGVRRAQSSERAAGDGPARPLALADVLTPFAAQRALGEVGPAGPTPRMPLAGEWADDMIALIDQHSAPGVAHRVRDALDGRVPADEGELVTALVHAQVEPERWSAILDAVVCDREGLEIGRVDIGRAPEAVLRTLPGIGAEQAARLVQERASLSPVERTAIAWPVTRGVLTAEQFAALAPHIAVRSWLWRVRIATGSMDDLLESEALEGVQVWDIVVDLSEATPRFASLRDSTLLPVAIGLAAQIGREGTGGRAAQDSADSLAEPREESPPEPPTESPLELPAELPTTSPPRAPAGARARIPAGPAQAGEGASPAAGDGRSPRDAPAAHTPTGGLSGRWRTRGTHESPAAR